VLRKVYREHGEFAALVYSDADMYVAQQRYNKPGTLPLAFQTEVSEGCPLDCGMCPEHKQHAEVSVWMKNTSRPSKRAACSRSVTKPNAPSHPST
jgi:uncharacterized radical SAM superfamily Fe-S cluster-containing enzyme